MHKWFSLPIPADAPGMTPEDVHIEFQNGMLKVSGEKKGGGEKTEERAGTRVHRSERTFSSFTRYTVVVVLQFNLVEHDDTTTSMVIQQQDTNVCAFMFVALLLFWRSVLLENNKCRQ